MPCWRERAFISCSKTRCIDENLTLNEWFLTKSYIPHPHLGLADYTFTMLARHLYLSNLIPSQKEWLYFLSMSQPTSAAL